MKELKRKIFKYPFLLREIVLNYPNEKRNFRSRLGYELNLKHPKSLNEKIVWKKIHDRNPLLPIVADKVKVRDFVKAVLEEDYHNILIPLYQVIDNPNLIRFDMLPAEYVIKANHGSGMNIIVSAKDRVDTQKTIKTCKGWLKEDYGLLNFEWAYQKIHRKVLLEKLLRNHDDHLPDDYKFHMINGKCVFIQVDQNKFSHHTRSLYTADWMKIPVKNRWEIGPEVPIPLQLDKMIHVSEALAKYFDYIRVDFYICQDELFFGELTNYPGSGSGSYSPVDFDFCIAKNWQLSENYWKANGAIGLLRKLS